MSRGRRRPAQALEEVRGAEPAPGFGRRHLLELHEQSWCPASLRTEVTAFLEAFARVVDVYGPVRAKLLASVRASGAERVLDLCSGGGGPWPSWAASEPGERLPPVLLSDSYPNSPYVDSRTARAEAGLSYHPALVDARRVPAGLTGFRTLFAALHHFRPDEAEAILRDAVAAGEGIAAFEPGRRHIASLLAVFAIPLTLLVIAPFLRPFRWRRLFWTYLVPALPLVLAFDGWVSCLRTYTPTELRRLTAAADPAGTYRWETGRSRMGRLPLAVTYLIGRPR